MVKKDFVWSVIASLAWLAPEWSIAATSQPNIVHIVADDLGWKDVGFNGCTDIKTPNLDKLAAEGAKFTQFYVAADVHAHARGADDGPLSVPLRTADGRHSFGPAGTAWTPTNGSCRSASRRPVTTRPSSASGISATPT